MKDAIAAYEEAQKLDRELKISAYSWNILCWQGTVWGHAAEIMDYCDKAVDLKPEDGGYRDSRGVARAHWRLPGRHQRLSVLCGMGTPGQSNRRTHT